LIVFLPATSEQLVRLFPLAFATFGHGNALDPQGCILTDAVGSATGQTVSNIRLSGAPSTAPKVGYYFEITVGTGIGNAGYVKTYTAGANYEITPYVDLDTALDATSTIKVYRDAPRVPAHIVATENIDLSATQKTSVNTAITNNITASGGIVEANVKEVNDVTITGDGSATPFQV